MIFVQSADAPGILHSREYCTELREIMSYVFFSLFSRGEGGSDGGMGYGMERSMKDLPLFVFTITLELYCHYPWWYMGVSYAWCAALGFVGSFGTLQMEYGLGLVLKQEENNISLGFSSPSA